jgi:hypothetical protein
MKIPHYNYLITLIAGKLNNQEIFKDLQKHSLQAPLSKDLSALREKIKLGQEDYFDGNEPVDLNWLNELGIEAMFGYKFGKQVAASLDGIEGAFRVLNDANMYRTITSLAMSGVTPEDIELIVNGKYDIEYSSADLDQFLYYFFNVSKWSRHEKDLLIQTVKNRELAAFYNMALNEEKDFLMWKLGVAPNKSFDAMLRDMIVDSYYNFKEQATRNPEQAQKWGILMLKVQERLEKVEKDLNSDSDAMTDLESLFIKAAKREKKVSRKTNVDVVKSDVDVPAIVTIDELN